MTSQIRSTRIVLVTRNFPPLLGGMEKLNFYLAKELSKTAQVQVIGPTGASEYHAKNMAITTCPKSIFLYLPVATIKILLLAATSLIRPKSARPQLVLAGSGVTAPVAWLLARLTGSRFAVYLHGLDVIANSIVYKSLFLPMIRKADFWIVNSSATKQKAMEAGVPESGITIISPGVELEEKQVSPDEIQSWRATNNIQEGPLLISVGRLTKRKGLQEFIRRSFPKIVNTDPDTQLLVIGSEPKNALQKNSVGIEALRKAALESGVQNNIRFLGTVSDEELSLIYSCADAHIFPIIATRGDMEGFGMVALESAARGVPTVAFAEGGVVDAVGEGESGYLLPPGDYNGFANAVIALRANTISPDQIRSFANKYAWPKFGEKIRQIIQ